MKFFDDANVMMQYFGAKLKALNFYQNYMNNNRLFVLPKILAVFFLQEKKTLSSFSTIVTKTSNKNFFIQRDLFQFHHYKYYDKKFENNMEQLVINDDENNKENSKNINNKLFNFNRLFTFSSTIYSNFCNNKNDEKNKVLRIIVEGNIGSGKTTFLSIFMKNCSKICNDPLIIPEPVELWRNVGGVNIFQLLADDPKRWSFTFQSYVQLTMLKIHELMPEKGNVKVMERSIYSARYCFVENLLQKNLLSNCEYHVLNQWFDNCLPLAQIDLIIYLRTNPDIVFKRIQKRGRPEETKITLDYLRSLHNLHEDWLINKKFPLPAPVLIIDANTPLEDLLTIYEEQTDGILREHQILAQ